MKEEIKPIKPIEESESEMRERLKRPVGAMDYAIVKQTCPDIPDELLMQLLFGGR